MSIRETLNEKPAIAYGLSGGLVLLALIIMAFHFLGGANPAATPAAVTNQAYFSDDDGATYFADDAMKIPPYSHNGKMAYQANVFRCGSGKSFVGYLARFTDQAKRDLEAKIKAGQFSPRMLRVARGQMLAKRPGPGKWVSPDDAAAYEQVENVLCPDGRIPAVVTPATP